MSREYRVVALVAGPRASHSDFISPEVIYTLFDLSDIKTIRVRFHSKPWKVGDTIEIAAEELHAALV